MEKLSLALALLSLVACASTTPLKPLTLGTDSLKGTVMVLDYALPTDSKLIPEDGCQLIFARKEDKAGFTVELHPSQHRAIVAAGAGHYILMRVYCSDSADWRYYEKAPVFYVHDDKINYLGAFRIQQADANQDLAMGWSDKKTASSEDLLASLHPEDRARFVYLTR